MTIFLSLRLALSVMKLKSKTVISLGLNSILLQPYSVLDEYARRRLLFAAHFTYTLFNVFKEVATANRLTL